MTFKEQELQEIYGLIIEELLKKHPDTVVNLWFKDLKLASLSVEEAVFVAQSDLRKSIIENKYSDDLSAALLGIVGFEPNVIIHSSENGELIITNSNEPVNRDKYLERKRIDITENGKYTFDNFIEGSSNKFALAAAKAVAFKDFSKPDFSNTYNPLFIYGPSGVGKTHILYAITNKILENYPDKKIVYIKSEEFTNQLVESFQKKTTAQFREKYRNIDVLLIDDIQFVAGRIAIQEELFNTFNSIYEANKQIILTSDRPPQEIQTLEDRLRTRFMSGLIADISLPDFDLRYAILKQKSLERGLDLSPTILRYIADNVKSSTRHLTGVLNKLAAIQLLDGTDITMDCVKASIGDFVQGEESDVKKMDEIIFCVSKRYGVKREDILSSKRTKEIVEPRHICVYVALQCTKLSRTQIAEAINRDRTTLNSSEKWVKDKMAQEKDFNFLINDIIHEIRNM